MLVLVFVLVSRHVHCTYSEPESNKTTDYDLFERNKEVRSISDATVATIRDFYLKSSPSLSISRGSSNDLAYQKQSEILNRILLLTSTEIAYSIEEPEYLKKAVRMFNLFFVDGLDGFRCAIQSEYLLFKHIHHDLIQLNSIYRRIFQKLSVKYFDHSGYYTIVLTERMEEPYELIKSIFTDLWSLHIINVNILSFEDIESGSSVFTFFPYAEDYCDDIRPVLWDYFIDGHFTLNKDIFATKLTNFHGCPITLATYEIPPYVMLTHHPNRTTTLDGIEGILFSVLSRRLNFRPVIITVPGKYLSTDMYFDMVDTLSVSFELLPIQKKKKNYNFACRFQLQNNEVNLTMCAIVNTMERSEDFTSTFPHYHVSVVLTTVLRIPFTSIERLLLPFQPIIWIIIIVTLLFALNIIYVILIYCSEGQRFVFGRSNHTPFLNTINIFLGGAIMRPPTRNFARTLLAFWLLGTLVLRSSYQGALFEFLHSRKSAQALDTLEKLVDNNRSIYTTPQIFKMLFESSPHLRNK